MAAIDVSAGFAGEVLGPVPIDEAASRIRVYCTSRYSGWAVYDLAGISARAAGLFTEVSTWSLLFANTLNGRVDITQLADFNRALRREFADRIGRIPADQDLHAMTEEEVAGVIRACQFGFNGAWRRESPSWVPCTGPPLSRCSTATLGWRSATSATTSASRSSASA
ncbi:hypothetical protein GCM10009827_119130 [Dactylosporangium maewongense]|uniref:Uncharacterized protein n=2 Tax=Dactylosporangium maewongense TaxID=634393 RepID=A0ABN2DJX8_9ACTN